MNCSFSQVIRYCYVSALTGVLSLQALEHTQMIWRPWMGERPLENALIDTKQLMAIMTEDFDTGGEFEQTHTSYPFLEQAHKYRAGARSILQTRDRLIVEANEAGQQQPLEPYAPIKSGGALLYQGVGLDLLCSNRSGSHIAALKTLICGYSMVLINTLQPAAYELEVPMLVSPLDAGFSFDDRTLKVRYLLTEYQWDLSNL